MPNSNNEIEKIEKIGDFEKNDVEHAIEPQQRKIPKEQFNAAIGDNRSVAAATLPESKTSLMETVRDLNYNEAKSGGQVSQEAIISQTKEAVQQIEQIRHTLESPNVNVKGAAQQLLQNKLNHIDESLKIALSRSGVEYNPSETTTATAENGRINPIERFLSYLTDGQYQLQNLGHELSVMSKNNKELSPVNMLAVQVKVSQIQQELELFSSLLNKALESIKTIMNIQV